MGNAKGTILIEAVKVLLPHRERALAALLPPKLVAYLDQRIVLASWYPLEDYAELLKTVMRVVVGGRVNPCEKMGRDAARAHMEGTYSRFNKSADRKAAFTLDVVHVRHRRDARGRARAGRAVMELLNFALPTREICDTFTGYQFERMTLLGFEDITVKHTKCRVIGSPSCMWELTWRG